MTKLLGVLSPALKLWYKVHELTMIVSQQFSQEIWQGWYLRVCFCSWTVWMRAPWKMGLQVPPRGLPLYEELSFLDCINPFVSAITCEYI